jgi:hypothetical protein
LQRLCGAINTDVPTLACPGLSLRIMPNPDYADELAEWMAKPSSLLPVEFYLVDWRSFADERITNRPGNWRRPLSILDRSLLERR